MVTRVVVPTKLSRGAFEWKWTGLLNGDDGGPITPNLGGVVFSDKTVHILGVFGTGGKITIEGSNDGTNWIVLTDPQGNDLIDILSASLEAILENPAFIRPNVTAGDGTTNLTVIIVGRAIMQLR